MINTKLKIIQIHLGMEAKLDKDWKKKLIAKYKKYKSDKKFKENDYQYILHLFRMEKDDYTQNRSGFLLVANSYSDETLLKLKEFIETCEKNWEQQEVHEKRPSVAHYISRREKKRKFEEEESDKQSESEKEKEDNKKKKLPKKRKVKIIDDNDDAEVELELSNQQDEDPNEIVETGGEIALESKSTMVKTKSIDTKRRPLAYYKGVYKRVMRCSRNASSSQAIDIRNKKRTSDIIKHNANTIVNNSNQISELEDIDENEIEEVDENEIEENYDYENEDSEENDEEEEADYELENEYSENESLSQESSSNEYSDEEFEGGGENLDDLEQKYL